MLLAVFWMTNGQRLTRFAALTLPCHSLTVSVPAKPVGPLSLPLFVPVHHDRV